MKSWHGLMSRAFLVVFVPLTAHAVEIYAECPKDIQPTERYVIYSHGRIAEGTDPRPVSPEYGVFDFPAIKSALFKEGGFNLIAIQRPKNMDGEPAFAAGFNRQVDVLESCVKRLVAAGVKAGRISLVGFSRGGQLTAYAATRLAELKINTAILAICSDGDFASDLPAKLGGNFLSIYETSDSLGSCAKLASRSQLTSFKEVAISTGKKHGAFFRPLPEWVSPLKEWLAKTNR